MKLSCLRALRATSPTSRLAAATSFCSAFTQHTTTATTDIPAFAATACSTNVAKISSACSCLPTPTPTACYSLIQNGDFSQDTDQDSSNIPHWITSCIGSCQSPRVQKIGQNNVFWFDYENDGGDINEPASYSLEQGFTRCPGVRYNLTLNYKMDDYLPPNYPVTIQVQVGLYGSVPQTFHQIVVQVYPDPNCEDCGNSWGTVYSYGPLTVPIPPLSAVPASGDDGVRITLNYPISTSVEMYIFNVTLLATS